MDGKIVFLIICFVYALHPFIAPPFGRFFPAYAYDPANAFNIINCRTWWIGAILFLCMLVFIILDLFRK